jgi:multicomponent K+:H+ antiporter subunit D
MTTGTEALLVTPVVLPLVTAAVLLVVERRLPRVQAPLAVAATVVLLVATIALLARADAGEPAIALLGNWPAPFGIVLVLDRLSAWMLVLTAAVALPCLVYALDDCARRGPHFHAFFQLQLAGLCGAFLTGDLFNLFVFFEVLLAASYALLLHGAQGRTLRAGYHYVVVNLAGSALFLIAASLFYGLAGTLNMADLAVKLAAAPAADHGLLRAAGMLLLVVFAVKAALLPLGFWLPDTYGSAPAPVAALFALMTKVGVYAVLRVSTLMFGADAGPMADLGSPALFVLALATIGVGALGTFTAARLKGIVAFLVIVSAGTLLAALATRTTGAVGGAVYYLAHSTIAAALLFLLADAMGRRRDALGDRLQGGATAAQPALLGVLFLGASMAIAGLPPLPGFIGKVTILAGSAGTPHAAWLWGAMLAGGLVVTMALARAGSRLFWKNRAGNGRAAAIAPGEGLALGLLAGASLALAIFAGPAQRYAAATATQLMAPRGYVERVLTAPVVPRAGQRSGADGKTLPRAEGAR